MKDPNTSSSVAQRGTDIHQLGEDCLNGKLHPTGVSVIREAGNGMFYAGSDMNEEAENYAKYVRALMTDPSAELFVESKVTIFPEYDVSGSVDAGVINAKTLHVIDLKTGGTAVDAENNSQMMMYAIGLYEEHEMFYEIDNICLHIVQDNAMVHNTNSWECSVEDLMDFKEWIAERARLALQEDSVCTPSEKACKWCTHSAKCVALNDYTTNIISGDFDTIEDVDVLVSTGSSEDLNMDRVLELLANEKLIMNIFKAYKGRVENDLMAGKDVDGWKLIQKRKNKSWVNETEAYDKIKSWFNKEDFTDYLNVKLITPTQASKLIKGGEISARKANIFDTLWEQKDGEVALAPASHKSPAVLMGDQFNEEE